MNITVTDVERMARDIVQSKIELGEEVQMQWAVHELIQGQGEIEGDGTDFYMLCAREFVYRVVKRVVDRYDEGVDDDDESQIRLKGFDRLQKAYTVKRENERVLVPIELITDDELLSRAMEFDCYSEGLKEHANELRRYVRGRHQKVA